MRYLFGIVCLALAACAPDDRHQPVTEPPVTERPEPVAGVTRANTEIARDFLDLSFRLESGRHLPVLSRFEGPVTVRLVPPAPPLASEDLDALLGRLRTEAGVDLRRVNGPAAITVSFVPHAQITDGELTPGSGQKVEFDISGAPVQFKVNGKPYDPATYRDLVLGNVEEWTITSAAASHPFHIHVNPFEIFKVLDKDGNDLSLPGSPDPDYAGMQGTWKDTIFVKPGLRVIVRTRYERYIGEYVLHCHILDHEDQGMMQNVRVLLPDGQGGALVGGHGGHGGH